MKRVLLLILIVLMVAGCTPQQLDSTEPVQSAVEIQPTLTPAPAPTTTPNIGIEFVRNDNNPAEMCVAVDDSYVYSVGILHHSVGGDSPYDGGPYIFSIGGNIKDDTYSVKGLKKANCASHLFRPINASRNELIHSIIYKKNDNWIIDFFVEKSDGDFTRLVKGIRKILYEDNNKIYYINRDNEVWAYDMDSEETAYVEDYVPEDLSYIPDTAVYVTEEHMFLYDMGNAALAVTDYNQVELLSIDISEYGDLIDVKAINDKIYMAFSKVHTTTYTYGDKESDFSKELVTIYSYDTKTDKIRKVMDSDKQLDASLASDGKVFYSFYDGNIRLKAYMINIKNDKATVVYDDHVFEYTGPDEFLSWDEPEYIYHDITHLLYKGGMLFAFNIDEIGNSIMEYKTDFIDPMVLRRRK